MGRTQTRRSDSSNSCHWTTADLATTDSHSRAGLKTSTLLVCVWLSQQQQQSVPCGRTTLCVCSKNIRLLSPHWQFFFLHSRKCLCGAIAKMLKCIKSEKEEKKIKYAPRLEISTDNNKGGWRVCACAGRTVKKDPFWMCYVMRRVPNGIVEKKKEGHISWTAYWKIRRNI